MGALSGCDGAQCAVHAGGQDANGGEMLHDEKRKGFRALNVGETTEHKAINLADVLYPCPTFFVGVGAHAITATGYVELGNPTLGIVAAALAGALHVEGADLRVAVPVAVVAPGIYAVVADLASEGFHLLGAGDGGGEGSGAELPRTVAVLFGLGEEGEADLLAHLLLLAKHAGVFALIAGGELGGDCTLDRAGFNVLGAIPTATFALHCADVLCAVGDAVVVHAPVWACGHAQVMTVGICLVIDYLGDFLLVHCFMFLILLHIAGGIGVWDILGQKKMRYLRRQRIPIL